MMNFNFFMLLQCLSLPSVRFKWPFLCIVMKSTVMFFCLRKKKLKGDTIKIKYPLIATELMLKTMVELYVDHKLIFLPGKHRERERERGGFSLLASFLVS